MKNIVLVSGYSGSGIATAIKVFEDNGYYCIDNLPVELILDVVNLLVKPQKIVAPLAIGLRVSSPEDVSFLKTLKDSQLEDFVIPVVSSSQEAHEELKMTFNMIFIDGGHSEEAAQNDYRVWSKKLNLEGVLAIHDVFPDPNDGGRPPYNIYLKALESGNFEEVDAIKSLRILVKKN